MKSFLKKFILNYEKTNIKNEDYYDNYVVLNILDEKQFRLYTMLMSILTKAFLDKELKYENMEETITALFEKLRILTSENKMMMIQLMADVIEDFVYQVGVEELYGYDYELVALSLYNTYCEFIDTTFDNDFYYPLTYNQLLKEFEEYLDKIEDYKEEGFELDNTIDEKRVLPKKRGRIPAIKKMVTRKHKGKYITYLTTVYKKPENMDERERKYYMDAYQRSFKRSITRDWIISEYKPSLNDNLIVKHMKEFIINKYNDEYMKYVEDYKKKITISDMRKAIIEERKRAYEEAGVKPEYIDLLIQKDIKKMRLDDEKHLMRMLKYWAENKALIDVVGNHIDEVAVYLNKALVNDLYLKGVSDDKILKYMKNLNEFIQTIRTNIEKLNNRDLYKASVNVSRISKSKEFKTILTHTETDNLYLEIDKKDKSYQVQLKHIGKAELKDVTSLLEKIVGNRYLDLISNKIKLEKITDEKGRIITNITVDLSKLGSKKIPLLQRILYKYNRGEI